MNGSMSLVIGDAEYESRLDYFKRREQLRESSAALSLSKICTFQQVLTSSAARASKKAAQQQSELQRRKDEKWRQGCTRWDGQVRVVEKQKQIFDTMETLHRRADQIKAETTSRFQRSERRLESRGKGARGVHEIPFKVLRPPTTAVSVPTTPLRTRGASPRRVTASYTNGVETSLLQTTTTGRRTSSMSPASSAGRSRLSSALEEHQVRKDHPLRPSCL